MVWNKKNPFLTLAYIYYSIHTDYKSIHFGTWKQFIVYTYMQTYSSYLMNMQTLSFDFRAWTKVRQELVVSKHSSLVWELKYNLEIHPKAGKMRAFHSVFFYFMKPIKDLEKIRSAVFENGCCCSEPTTWTLNLSKIIKQEQSRHRVGIFRLSIQHSGGKSASVSSTSARNPNDHDSSNQHLW